MIYESSYWKEDLTKIVLRMSKRAKQRKWTDRSFFNFEKDVFFAFYAIRKLMEADKLSQEVIDAKLGAICYPTTGKGMTKINNHRLHEHFDFSKGLNTLLDLQFVCNQIVHSYIFAPFFEENESLAGVYFCSDMRRNQQLYDIQLSEIIRCLTEVANDDPDEIHAVYDPQSRDYRVTLFSHEIDANKFDS